MAETTVYPPPVAAIVRSFSDDTQVRHISHKSSLGNQFFSRLIHQRNQGNFCDITLKVRNENCNIQAHKIVLAAFSEYFAAMFNPESNMKERKQEEIELILPNFSSVVFEKIIDYAYSGEAQLTTDNVQEFAAASQFFNADLLLNECGQFMMENMQDENCIEMLAFADVYSLQELRETSLSYARAHFEDVCHSPELKLLNCNTLKELINGGTLLLTKGTDAEKCEQLVLDMIISYIKGRTVEVSHAFHSPEEISELLNVVKLPFLSEERLESLKNEPLFSQNLSVTKVLNRAAEYKDGKSAKAEVDHWTFPRKFAEIRFMKGKPLADGRYLHPVVHTFDDHTWVDGGRKISGMKLWIRKWDGRPVLGGIEVFYNGIGTGVHGDTLGDAVNEFTLLPQETITSISYRTGWLVDMLSFHTNKGNTYGPFGGPGGGSGTEDFQQRLKNTYLAYISGSIVNNQGSSAITSLSCHWAYEAHVDDPPLEYSNVLRNPNVLNPVSPDLDSSYSELSDSDLEYMGDL